jgi:hypothetical protein
MAVFLYMAVPVFLLYLGFLGSISLLADDGFRKQAIDRVVDVLMQCRRAAQRCRGKPRNELDLDFGDDNGDETETEDNNITETEEDDANDEEEDEDEEVAKTDTPDRAGEEESEDEDDKKKPGLHKAVFYSAKCFHGPYGEFHNQPMNTGCVGSDFTMINYAFDGDTRRMYKYICRVSHTGWARKKSPPALTPSPDDPLRGLIWAATLVIAPWFRVYNGSPLFRSLSGPNRDFALVRKTPLSYLTTVMLGTHLTTEERENIRHLTPDALSWQFVTAKGTKVVGTAGLGDDFKHNANYTIGQLLEEIAEHEEEVKAAASESS